MAFIRILPTVLGLRKNGFRKLQKFLFIWRILPSFGASIFVHMMRRSEDLVAYSSRMSSCDMPSGILLGDALVVLALT